MYDTKHPMVGTLVKQVRCDSPEYQHFVGRQSRVTEAFVDEKGNLHVHTEDNVWCPARLVEPVFNQATDLDLNPDTQRSQPIPPPRYSMEEAFRDADDEGPTSQPEDPPPSRDFEGGF
jgi:hypothetical protein